jgi:hypothetical protein
MFVKHPHRIRYPGVPTLSSLNARFSTEIEVSTGIYARYVLYCTVYLALELNISEYKYIYAGGTRHMCYVGTYVYVL